MRIAIACLILATALLSQPAAAECKNGLLDQDFKKLAGDETINLCDTYKDKVVLVVNTASKCGYTPQYDGLEALYQEYGEQGLVVIGFPSNDFAGQEPGTENEIKDFCRLTYGVKFPMFEKTTVKGDAAHPFYKALAAKAGTAPKWNFHKYLIGRDGELIETFAPATKPQDTALTSAVKKALDASS